jgi:hypothetical protein
VSTSVEVFVFGALLAGFIGFAYSWLRLLKTSQEKSFGWRDWVSLAAIALVSLVVLLWFVMPAFWGSDFGDKVRVARAWTKVSVRICALGLVLCFLGRPRLIVSIAFACFGAAVFWVMSTVP